MRISAILFVFLMIIISCARQGTPSGGPRDTEPPKFLGANPDTLSLNVSTDLKEIKIDFDEYLILKDHTQNIVVSPPFAGSVTYSPIGTPNKSVRIKLSEPLEENTTYNINFGNSIQDNNEGNKLSYFQYVFSTGDYIDSLEITGNASVTGMRTRPENLLVALFKVDSTYNDSLVMRQKPFYVSRLDSAGLFKLNYLRSGTYQMVAFDDKIQNMQFDVGQEAFGFIEEPINLSENQSIDIQLFQQNPPYKVGISEQKDYGHLVFRFDGQPESVEIQPLDFEFRTSQISHEPKSDSLDFWFNPAVDSIHETSRRINFLVKNQDISDTVSLVYSNSIQHKLTLDRKTKLDYAPSRKVQFAANYPIVDLDSSYVKVVKDTLELPIRLIADAKNPKLFTLDFPIELASRYQIEIYPNAITDFFGKTNDSIQFEIRTQTRNDFGNLKLSLQNSPKHPFWIQLLNDKDEVLEERYTRDSEFEYDHLPAGNYYFKLLVDENENGAWDTGDFFQKRQPEKLYIYPSLINVRVLWDFEETWVIPMDSTEEDLDSDESDFTPNEKSSPDVEEDLP
jgi:uncharacterized protein (DUF2141 family)